MKFRIVLGALTLFSLTGCAPAYEENDQAASAKTVAEPIATGPMIDADGDSVGLASIVELDGVLALNLSLSSMPAGEKALHLHTTGACDGPDFKSAGGHLNPQSVSHGKMSETGPHLGDFPNITIAQDGLTELSLPIDGTPKNILGHIFDIDGTAVMIHAGPDDYLSDPAGAAGPRIACGILSKV